MKPSDISTTLEILVRANKPAIVLGEPGVGKTSVWQQTAARLDMDLLYTRLADKEPVDLIGLPVTDLAKGTTKWLTPEYFPRKSKRPLLWFFDEWSQGTPSVQNVAGQLLNERCLGDSYRLPDNVYIGAAANEAKHRAATHRIPAHIADRFWYLKQEADVTDWCKWAFKANLETEVIAFIRFRDKLLQAFDPSADVSPTCRSWEHISDVRKAMKHPNAPKINEAIEEKMYAGKIGDGAASEFMSVVKVLRNLPDLSAMLMNPANCALPNVRDKDGPATLCAMCEGIARKATDANIDRVVTIADRLADEFSVLLMLQAVGRDEKLKNTRAFIEWSVKHQEAMS